MRANPLRLLRNKFLRDAATLQVAGSLNQASQVVSTVIRGRSTVGVSWIGIR